MEKSKISVIIPAFNEAENIDSVIDQLHSQPCLQGAEMIVVDDGSIDRTGELAKAKGVKVIRHPYNKGNGASIKTGVRQAQGEILLFLDADGQHDLNLIQKMLELVTDYDLVIAARTTDFGRSWIRKLANYFLNALASYLSGFKIPDLTSGFRAAKKSVFKEYLHILPNGFSYPTTSTLAFLLSGYSVSFVPTTSFKRGSGTKSKIRPFQDFLRFIIIVARTVMLFGPLKIFIPVSSMLFLVGIIDLIYFFVNYLVIAKSSMLLILSSFIIFFFGLVADQIAQLRRQPK